MNQKARVGRRGLVRVEVHVLKEDAVLIHRLVAALSDPTNRAEARRLLQRFTAPSKTSLKVLLATAPLEGVDLGRNRDTGRVLDL